MRAKRKGRDRDITGDAINMHTRHAALMRAVCGTRANWRGRRSHQEIAVLCRTRNAIVVLGGYSARAFSRRVCLPACYAMRI